eukprot:scaffold28118_cov70-Phaeocystis_antarctica.AAC.7
MSRALHPLRTHISTPYGSSQSSKFLRTQGHNLPLPYFTHVHISESRRSRTTRHATAAGSPLAGMSPSCTLSRRCGRRWGWASRGKEWHPRALAPWPAHGAAWGNRRGHRATRGPALAAARVAPSSAVAIGSCRVAFVVDYERIGIRVEQRSDDRVVIFTACVKERGGAQAVGVVDISTLLDQLADARLVAAKGREMEGGTVRDGLLVPNQDPLVDISTRCECPTHACEVAGCCVAA